MKALVHGSLFLLAFQEQFCQAQSEEIPIKGHKLISCNHAGLRLSLNLKDLSLQIEKDSGQLLSALSLEMAYMEEALSWINDFLRLKKWEQSLDGELQSQNPWPSDYQFPENDSKNLKALSSFIQAKASAEDMNFFPFKNQFKALHWSLKLNENGVEMQNDRQVSSMSYDELQP